MAQVSQQLVQKQWERRVARMVSQGQTHDQVLVELLAANWSKPQANDLIQRTASRLRSRAIAMIVGCGLLALAATIITVATLSQAMSQGGEYFIWYGGIIGGGWGCIIGFVKLRRIRA